MDFEDFLRIVDNKPINSQVNDEGNMARAFKEIS